jgi:hypothetical protein
MSDVKPPAPPQGTVPFVDNLFAPEVFAHEATAFAGGNGIITITFSSHRFDNSVVPAVQKRVTVGRLVMPVVGAQTLALGLYNYLTTLGLAPMAKPDPDKVQ